MGRVGIVLCLEVSRLARNNADWYRLLDLCALTRTLIADTDGLYHPGDFNDRLVLGLKGTMSEAELHILRARLDGGIRHKAARGELRRGVPTGVVWGETDGEILFHPDEAVVNPFRTVFERFARVVPRGGSGCGSVRQFAVPVAGHQIAGSRGALGRAHLPCHPWRAHPSLLRRRLYLWPHPFRTVY